MTTIMPMLPVEIYPAMPVIEPNGSGRQMTTAELDKTAAELLAERSRKSQQVLTYLELEEAQHLKDERLQEETFAREVAERMDADAAAISVEEERREQAKHKNILIALWVWAKSALETAVAVVGSFFSDYKEKAMDLYEEAMAFVRPYVSDILSPLEKFFGKLRGFKDGVLEFLGLGAAIAPVMTAETKPVVEKLAATVLPRVNVVVPPVVVVPEAKKLTANSGGLRELRAIQAHPTFFAKRRDNLALQNDSFS